MVNVTQLETPCPAGMTFLQETNHWNEAVSPQSFGFTGSGAGKNRFLAQPAPVKGGML